MSKINLLMTISEENYIKVIYHLSLVSPKGVNTNAIAAMLETKASSVTDILNRRPTLFQIISLTYQLQKMP